MGFRRESKRDVMKWFRIASCRAKVGDGVDARWGGKARRGSFGVFASAREGDTGEADWSDGYCENFARKG
jgi:hypothetical protein